MSSENLPMLSNDDEVEPLAAMPAASTAEQTDAGDANPYRVIHHLLRGRYVIAGCLGVVLGAILGIAGWHLVRPLYVSEGLIRIAFDTPKVMQQNQEYRPMDVFEAFMQSQQAMIASHRVIDLALKNPVWKEKGYGFDAKGSDVFASDLKVEHRAGTEHLKISYTSDDPEFAALAVQSVTDAYVNLYQRIDKESNSEKVQALQHRRDDLSAKLDEMEASLRNDSSEFGDSNIEKFHEAAVQRLTRVESALIDVRIALALAKGSQREAAVRYTPRQIARFDPTMTRYMTERDDLQMRLEQLRMRGYGEAHKQVIEAEKALEMVADRITSYAVTFQGQQASAASLPPSLTQTGQPGLSVRSVEELTADQSNLTQLDKEVKDQLAGLGEKKLKFEAARSAIAKVQSDLADVAQKLSLFQVEASVGGRLSVMSSGEIPLLPVRDRRPHLATAGAMAGLMLPAAGFVALGLNRKRCRSSDDAAEMAGSIPLLGILPQLPDRLTDPSKAADAAQCVHQIRVMLQVKSPGHRPVAYLVTSACPGEGKTSLTAALALSFATAGCRTLLIDADLIGQRLTRGYKMEDKPGFREVMSGSYQLVTVFHAAAVKGLSILPAGISDGRDACAVSATKVKKLLNSARKQFDVILVDSGPVLGSLEALVVAGLADSVILTISREQQKPLVDRAVRQLNSVGARIAGMVFNKAEHRDFQRSVGASSLRSVSSNPDSAALVKAGVTSTSGFGSLVDSVQTYLPESE